MVIEFECINWPETSDNMILFCFWHIDKHKPPSRPSGPPPPRPVSMPPKFHERPAEDHGDNKG